MNLPDSVYADILANPEDDGPRRVYADYLIERGDPRGEMIVVQCELASCAADDDRRKTLEARQAELVGEASARWRAVLGLSDLKSGALLLRRGLIEEVRLPVEQLVKIGGVLRQIPLRSLTLTHLDDAGAAALATLPAIPTLTDVSLRNGQLGHAGAEALGQAPLFAASRTVELRRLNFTSDSLRRFAVGAAFAGLTALSMSDSHGAMRELAEAPWLPALRSLVLARMYGDVAAVLEGERWRELRVLDLDDSYLTDVQLARIPVLHLAPLLTQLAIPASHVGAETVRALVKTRRLGKLQQLALRGYCQLDPDDIVALRRRYGDKLVIDGPLHALP